MNRIVQPAVGNTLRCKGWRQEGILRMLENTVANGESPEKLIIYGSTGQAARDWDSYHAIVSALNILQIVNYLKTGTVDAGTIFEATALSHRLDYVKIPAQFNIPSTAHLIRLTFPVDNEAAVARFEVFILKQHAIFKRHGFKLLS